MSIAVFLKAAIFGLTIAFSPGAAFFGIIQTSLSKGFKFGISFALGSALSDLLFIALCLWGLAGVMESETAYQVFSIVGGCVLILYGIYTFFSKKMKVSDRQQQQVMEVAGNGDDGRFKFLKTISKGFFFNFINPGAWFLWIGITPISGETLQERVFFFGTVIATIFAFDILKSFFSGKIKNVITPKVLFIVNRVIGVAFCIVGAYMMLRQHC